MSNEIKGENDFERFLLENNSINEKIYKLHTTLNMNQFLKILNLNGVYKYKKEQKEQKCSTCFICYENFDNKKHVFVRKLKCQHEFHKKCVDKWLYTQFQESKDEYTCPLCRKNT